jgi:TolA-binding protein
MAAGVAAAATALHWRESGRQAEAATAAAPRRLVAPVQSVASDVPALPEDTLEQTPVAGKAQRPAHGGEGQESFSTEIALLQGARVAYARGNFLQALALVAKHSRRFPNGRLTEEREGLRARSLVGAGQIDEAGRVVTAFARRFPRSVLLPRLQEMMRAEP